MGLVLKDTNQWWPNGVVPFVINMGDFNATQVTAIQNAISFWTTTTLIQFVPRTTEADFVRFRAAGASCQSAAGQQGGDQAIRCDLSPGAFTAGNVAHEIGHALGFLHEHKRPERDAVVAVSQAADQSEPADYAIVTDQLPVGVYDCNSIRHYGKIFGKITNVDPACNAMGQRNALSPGDIATIGFMYGVVPDRTPIAALRRNEDHMEIWVVGDDGQVRGAWWDGQWRAWYTLFNRRSAFPPKAWLAALVRSGASDHMEVWGVGNDNNVHGTWWDGSSWQSWYTLGAPSISGPPGPALTAGVPIAARSRHEDHMELWVVGNDRQLHGTWWDGSSWQAWYTLPGRTFPPGAFVASHSRHEDHMELWAVGDDFKLHGIWWDGNGGGWQPWYTLDGPVRFPPGAGLAVAARHEDHMELWGVASDPNGLHGIWWDGNAWQPWYRLATPPLTAGAPLTALSRHDNHMELWCVAADGRLGGTWWDGTWHAWYSPDPTPVPDGTPPVALSRNEDHMEVWCVAPADPRPFVRGVQGTWWDGNAWRPFYRVT